MSLNNFTRAQLEARAADQLALFLTAAWNLNELNERVSAELAAGTLDTADFYQSDQADKANIVGALNQAGATYAWLTGKGQVAAPSGDPLAYAQFLIGLS